MLRELEELSYRELADVLDLPMGTVMSGLSRARLAFRAALTDELARSGLSTKAEPRVQEAGEVPA